MPYKDKEKRLECVRQWRLRNTLRIKAWKREYRQIHRHRLADYKRIRNIEKQRKGKYEQGIRGEEEDKRMTANMGGVVYLNISCKNKRNRNTASCRPYCTLTRYYRVWYSHFW